MALAVGAYCLLMSLTPLHLTLWHPTGSAPSARLRGKSVNLVARPLLIEQRLLIEHRAPEGSAIFASLPTTSLANQLPPDSLEKYGDFRYDEASRTFTAKTPGSRLELKGSWSDLELQLWGAEAHVKHNGAPLPTAPSETPVRLALPSPTRVSSTSQTFSWAPIRGELSALPQGSRVELSVAHRPVAKWSGTGGELTFEVSRNQLAGEILRAHATGFRSVLLALLVVGVLLLAGLGPFVTWKGALRTTERFALGGASALGFVVVASTSLAYVLPLTSVTPLVLGATLLAAGLSVRALWRNRSHLEPRSHEGHGLLGTGIALGLLVGFWPAFSAGDWFLGQLQTDAYYYPGLAERLQSQSLFGLGSINGFGMRAAELVFTGVLSNGLGINPRQAMLVAAMATHIFTALFAFVVGLRVTGSGRAAGWASLLTAVWAPSAGLYMEAYFTQYLLVVGLAALLATSLTLLAREASEGPLFAFSRESLAWVAATAYCLAMYPYFALALGAVVPAALWVRRRNGLARELRAGIILFVVLLLVCNLNLAVIVHVGQTAQFLEGLNGIARNVVFPFYKEPRFFSILLGLSPFHVSAEQLNAYDVEFSNAAPLFRRGLEFLSALTSLPAVIGAALVLTVGASMGLRAAPRKPAAWLLVGILALYALVGAVQGLKGQTYGYAKLLWTLSALLPLLLAPLILLGKPNSLGRRMVVPAWAALSLCALLLGNTAWYANPRGPVNLPRHLSLSADLQAALRSVESLSPRPREVYFAGPAPGLRNTDKDRVLVGQLVPSLEALGITCGNCVYSPLFGTVHGFRAQTACTKGALLVSIGSAAFRCSERDRLVFAGEYLGVLESAPAPALAEEG